jgi:methenyltetrahydromethanopterin cyclohydrolase
MSIVTKAFYAVKCDSCGVLFPPENEFEEYTYWDDSNYAVQCAEEDSWLTTEHLDHYCNKCYEFDENDNVIIKNKNNSI